MQIFIANVSFQRQTIAYNITLDKKGEYNERLARQAFRSETIERGQQIPVGGDLGMEQIQEIIDHLTPYGLAAEKDIPNNLEGVHNLVFNIGQPTSRAKLEALHAHNTGVRTGMGAKRREAAAIAANKVLSLAVQEEPKVFDIEFEQEAVSELGEKSITEGFHVVNNVKDATEARKREKAA
jgi:hypothetical protein